jgi:DNA-directed RNA polymerase subunit H (RpoH/RPB5)
MELSNVIMNNIEMMETSIENLLLMFHRRGYFNTNNKDKIEKIVKDITENKIVYLDAKEKIGIFYDNNVLKNISSGSEIDDFLSKNHDIKKFIIVKEFPKKVYKQVQNYKNSEIFFIFEFLEDIPSKVFIPEHKLMTQNEINILKQNYEIENLPKIYNTDKMSRYYNAKIGDIFRIIRYNLNTGTSVYYRTVINDSNIFFL